MHLELNQIHPQYITDATGNKTAIVLPIEEFRELLEDIDDLATLAERREEPTVSHKVLLAELKQHGLL